MKKIAIYLAGSIQKGHERSNESKWTEEDRQLLRKCLPGFALSFLNPDLRTDDLSDQMSVFGRDMLQVHSSDLVFVDARDRRGLGVGAEMMWAKYNRIPVLTWAPRESHYHKSHASILGVPVQNWVHPFVESLSDAIVSDLKEGAAWIETKLFDPAHPKKGMEFVHAAMGHYKKTQFPQDEPMKKLISSCENLRSRIDRIPQGFHRLETKYTEIT